MIKPRARLVGAVLAATIATFAGAQGVPSGDQRVGALVPQAKPSDTSLDEAAAAIRNKLQITFRNVLPEFIGPGPIDGLYEMVVNNQLIYYVPEKDWLLFGEFFNADGISESQRRLSQLQAKKIESLPLEDAIVIGNGPNKVIEFSDPDCPYCRRWEQFAQTHHQELTRYVFLVPLDRLHPTARGKAVDTFCAKEPGQRLEDYLLGRKGTAKLMDCEAGRRRLAIHEGAARKLGVTGTPTLVVNGTLVAGFNQARIQNLLKPLSKEKAK